MRLFPSTDGNQCHVPGRQAPPSSRKLENGVVVGVGGGVMVVVVEGQRQMQINSLLFFASFFPVSLFNP